MSDRSRQPLSQTGHPVWERLSAYRIGSDGFAARLARENGWSLARAARVIDEYKRFCFLAVTAGHVVTPSDPVDQAWHLHLTDSRDYWERFCPDVLGAPLHHAPTTGDDGARHRHFEQYAETLRSYQCAFGAAPPADLWPAARHLFDDAPRARRVLPRDAYILPKKALWLAVPVAAAVAIVLLVPH